MRIRFFLLILFFAGFQCAMASISGLILKQQATPLVSRVDFFSQYFLGKPYEFEPLGEGRFGRYNQKPLYRFDRFSCQTYVETVIALAKAKNFKDFKRRMIDIRYKDGEISFFGRNHFASFQWVPDNISSGYIKNINKKIIGVKNVDVAKVTIDLPRWYQDLNINRVHSEQLSYQEKQKRYVELKAEYKQVKKRYATIDYIPKADLFYVRHGQLFGRQKILNRIPDVAVMLVVRKSWPSYRKYGTYMLVSHMALIIRKNKKLYLRMARSVRPNRVQQIGFVNYFSQYYSDPSMIGVSLYSIS